MEHVVISDTNIFIDLLNVNLIEEFFQLPWEVHTTEPILLELKREGQKSTVELYKSRKLLHVDQFTDKETFEIIQLRNKLFKFSNLSIQDCSVWYSAKKLDGILLTGDGQLRKNAKKHGVDVRGILFILDKLVETEIIDAKVASVKIENLYMSNNRLPLEEKQKRLNIWGYIKKEGGSL